MKHGDKIFYKTESDELVNFRIKKKKIDGDFKYIHKNIFYRFFSAVTYRLIATPIFWIYLKLFKRVQFKNKRVLKNVKGGYFIYANHTNQLSDGISPAFICFPNKPYLICNSDNVSIPLLGKLLHMWGALPLPDTMDATKNFTKTIQNLITNKQPIIIYPEAHLWPYYTKIREFSDKSFRYPVEYNVPIFTFTTTYHKRKFSKKPRIEIYVDGPFYKDDNLDKTNQRKQLWNIAYKKMQERAKLNTYEFVEYIKRSKND